MEKLFEKSDVLNSPIEAMIFDSEKEVFPILNHWHYFVEIIYMLRGCIRFTSGENSGILAEGELALFHPKEVHSICGEGEIPPVYILLKFDINRLRITSDYSPRFSEVFRRAASSEKASAVLTQEQCEKIDVKNLLTECVEEVRERQYCYGTVLDANVYILLTRIVRLWQENGFSFESSIAPADSDPIYTITEYIDAHYSEDLRVAELAEQCGMSYSHFAKSFKNIYRQSCKQFINYLRVSKAADYLIFTDNDLNYISQETGFSDCSHFIRTFKEIKGVTPKKYRDTHRR